MELLDELKSVQLRHDQIGYDDIDPFRPDHVECFGSVAGVLHLIALPPQDLANQISAKRIIFHDQNSWHDLS